MVYFFREITYGIILLLFTPYLYAQDGLLNLEGEPGLAYWKLGSKPVKIIALHGGPAAPHQYLRPELDRLAEFSTLIFYDQRGCGKSDIAKSYHWKTHVKDLDRLIEFFAPNEEVFLFGSSWGSLLALAYALDYPEKLKGIILSGTVQWYGKGTPAKYKFSDLMETEIIEYQMNELRLFQEWSSQEGWKSEWKTVSRTFDFYHGRPSIEPVGSMVSAPTFNTLKAISVPCLIFMGDGKHDTVPDWGKKYHAILPHSSLIEVLGAGHDPWLANPNLFIEECKKFIQLK